MKKSNSMMIFLAIAILLIFVFKPDMGSQAVTGAETMTRTVPSQVDPSSTFTVTYTAVGASGQWGATIIDDVSGGCTPSHKETLMIHDIGDSDSKSVTYTAPSSGTCTFTGDYQFGSTSIKNFPNAVVSVCTPTCVRPADMCIEASTVSDGCGGFCTGQWTVTRNTDADTDCDNLISTLELQTYGQSWLLGQISRTQIGQAIQAWALI